jgi:hypothetical protein
MKCHFLILIIFFSNCTKVRQATCEEAADAYRPDTISMIVTEPSKSVYDFSLKGVAPVTGKENYFKSKNYTWALDFNEFISVGDTVVKSAGELNFYIHKKDTILIFPFECQGEIYD